VTGRGAHRLGPYEVVRSLGVGGMGEAGLGDVKTRGARIVEWERSRQDTSASLTAPADAHAEPWNTRAT